MLEDLATALEPDGVRVLALAPEHRHVRGVRGRAAAKALRKRCERRVGALRRICHSLRDTVRIFFTGAPFNSALDMKVY